MTRGQTGALRLFCHWSGSPAMTQTRGKMKTWAFLYQNHYRILIGLEGFSSSVNLYDIVHIMYYIYTLYTENLWKCLRFGSLCIHIPCHGIMWHRKATDKTIGAHTGASRYSLSFKLKEWHRGEQGFVLNKIMTDTKYCLAGIHWKCRLVNQLQSDPISFGHLCTTSSSLLPVQSF